MCFGVAGAEYRKMPKIKPKKALRKGKRNTERPKHAVVRTLIAKYKGLCAYCGVTVNFTRNDDAEATIDHVVPKSRGGAYGFGNLALSCRRCNCAKSDSAEFAADVESKNERD